MWLLLFFYSKGDIIVRNAIQLINKKTLSDATGISYSRLRKFASGEVKTLKSEEIKLIHSYFINLASVFKENKDE